MKKLVLLLFIPICGLLAKPQFDIDSLLYVYSTSGQDNAQEIEGFFIGKLYHSDRDSALAIQKELISKTAILENKELYIILLIHSYHLLPFDQQIKLLTEAAELSIKYDKPHLLGASYMYKGIAFRDNSIADSAMMYALKSRDIFEVENLQGELSEVLQLIADMHYHATAYEEAEKTYKEIELTSPGLATTWRYSTIQNNLGLIKIKQGLYDEAERYFLNSLSRQNPGNSRSATEPGLAYLYRKLLELSILQKRFDKANEYFSFGYPLTTRLKRFEELPGYYIGKSQILNHESKYDSSLIYLDRAIEAEKKHPDLKFKIDLYKTLADTYTGLNNFSKANMYLTLYIENFQRADSSYNNARLLHAYATHNYNKAMQEIETKKKERNLLIVILSFALLTLAIFALFYVRLKKSNKMLVEKSLRLAHSNSGIFFAGSEINEESLPDESRFSDDDTQPKKKKDVENATLDSIIEKLELLIEEEKIYLNPFLTIQELAKILDSNRTYLLKAIQKKYNVNFISLVNGYRIREAIKIMNSEGAKSLNMDGIAGKSGFNNRVTFAKAFKQITGVSPSFFLANIKDKE